MKIVDNGVIGASFMDFMIPTEFAKKALYYCPQFGHFYCDNHYRISRESLDLFLLMYVRSGTLWVETQGHTHRAGAGEAVLLDCRGPHAYYCKDSLDFLWTHFNGGSSAAYTEYLCGQNGVVFSRGQISTLDRILSDIFQRAQVDMADEHHISLLVNQALCCLADAVQESHAGDVLLQPAMEYIRGHYQERIDLERLAELCQLSVSHLVRCFKNCTNRTPHEYLLSYRLRQSKQRLSNSSATIEEIAEQCGFNSASHFTRAFRRNSGMTPSEFRKMRF